MKIKQFPRQKIVFRLWGFMMLLILGAIAFMWVVQICLFEQNYIDANVGEVKCRLEPIAEKLKTTELSDNAELLSVASKSVNGKMILFDKNNNILVAYNNSHPIGGEGISDFIGYIQQTPDYQSALEGAEYQKIINYAQSNLFFEIGMPVIWQGERAVLFFNHPIQEVSKVQKINRRQLITLSILLSIISGVIAWLLSRQFTKPIHIIKSAVERLTEGDLAATPGLNQKDELGQLSDSVAELSLALQRVDILRKEVISNVSHELRAPLSAIIGYGELVRDVSWQFDAERNENLNLIISEARRMSTMVDDILDYSQFQAGYIHLDKAEYNLFEIVGSEVDVCRQVSKDFGIKITLQSENQVLPVFLDALKISQVMRNMLNNAVNHTDDNETILVSITQEDGIKVTVSNPGKPIPEEKIKMIWERYYSSQHMGTRRQGTGIGLSIVSTNLAAHGFTYGVECKNGWNNFWFHIHKD